MDYQKLDASLISAVEDREAPALSKLSVFVHINPLAGPKDGAGLAELLGPNYSAGSTVVTASLTRTEIDALSRHTAIKSMGLSRKLRMLPSH